MAISIRAAFKNVLSERYNKTNAAYYIALVLIAIISYICSASFSEKEILAGIFGLIIYIAAGIFISGIYTMTANNGYKNLPSVLPNLLEEYKGIAICGLKMYAGIMILTFILTFCFLCASFPIVGILCLIGFAVNNSIITAILIAVGAGFSAFLLLYIILIQLGLIFNFYKSLEIEDLINFKKSWNFIKLVRKPLSSYILRAIGICLCSVILFIVVFLAFFILLSIPAIFNNIQFNDTQNVVIFAISYAIIFPVFSLIHLDLAIQFLQESDKYLPDEMKTEPEEEFDEYLEEDSDDDNDDYIDEN